MIALRLAQGVEGADVVVPAVHGFAGPGGVSPATVDYQGNINLIDTAGAAGAQLVLMSVAGAAADSPMELFRMKHAAEEHLRASGVRWTIVRATAFFELWIGVLSQSAARSGRPLVFGRGDNPINFVSVTDVAALVEHVVTDPAARGRTLQIGGPDTSPATRRRRDPGSRLAHQPPRHVPGAASHSPDRRTSQARARPSGALGAPYWTCLSPRPRCRCCPPGLSRHPVHSPRHVPGPKGREHPLAGPVNWGEVYFTRL